MFICIITDYYFRKIKQYKINNSYLHSTVGGGGNPLEFGVEWNLVDQWVNLEFSWGGSQIHDVPNAQSLVFASGGEVSAVGADGKGVDASFLVGLEGVFDLEGGVPDLESAVPADWGEIGVELGSFSSGFQGGGVSQAGDPVGVVVELSGEFVISKSVPELDALVKEEEMKGC